MAVTRTHTDSLDFFEFHPKGLQLKNWNVCVENKNNMAALYWLGETTRRWFYFEKQTGNKRRCASTNELRDIANIDDESGFTIGFPFWSESFIGGEPKLALKIPIYSRYAGIPDGNAITVKNGDKWIPVEYDSEPRTLVISSEDLPEAGETLTIQIIDDAKHKAVKEIVVPAI